MRKLTYFVAATLDGFIAHSDGSFAGFLMQGEHVAGYLDPLQAFDTVLMGRETYDVGRHYGVTNPYPALEQYLFSRTLSESPDPAVQLVRDDAAQVVRELKARPGKGIWLCGGSTLAGALAREGLLDELVVKLNPVIFGAGKSLFAGALEPTALTLLDSKVFDNGVIVLRYRVKSPG